MNESDSLSKQTESGSVADPDDVTPKSKIALTMGDVSGVGPEVTAASFLSPELHELTQLVVVGEPNYLRRALNRFEEPCQVIQCSSMDEAIQFSDTNRDSHSIACWNPTSVDLSMIQPGQLHGNCGKAAYDWLVAATAAARNSIVDAIVTAPLNKAALHLAGLHYPGHTEILAEQCGVDQFAMMLYLPPGELVKSPCGLGVAHVTLHTSIASVPDLLTTESILDKILLIDEFLAQIGCQSRRIGVCALNPHAGETGLFGDEESRIIAPAVARAEHQSVNVTGPLPADTLLQRAVRGEFDGIVAMYHDQGHIALKLIGFQSAVNITLGLPIVRTSPSHGTAFDIAWQGIVDPTGMQQAIRIAAQLAKSKQRVSFSHESQGE